MNDSLRSGHLDVRIHGATAMITVPTISKLRIALKEMEMSGVNVDSPLTISHLANALGTFVIRELNIEETAVKQTYTATITPEAVEAMRRQAAERVEVTVDAQTLIALRGLVARFDSEDFFRKYMPDASGDINAVRVLVDRLEDAFARKEQP